MDKKLDPEKVQSYTMLLTGQYRINQIGPDQWQIIGPEPRRRSLRERAKAVLQVLLDEIRRPR